MALLHVLPPELVHAIAYDAAVLTASDIVALACTCSRLHAALLGSPFSAARAHALAGIDVCIRRKLWYGAHRIVAAPAPAVDPHRSESDPLARTGGLAAIFDAADPLCRGWRKLVAALLDVNATTRPLRFGSRRTDTYVAMQVDRSVGVLAWSCGRDLPDLALELITAHKSLSPGAARQAGLVAALKDQLEVLKLLIVRGDFDLCALGDTALRIAARFGAVRTFEYLLASPEADPTAGGNYALHMAAEFGYLAIIQSLLGDSRVDLAAAHPVHAVKAAAESNHLDIVKLLLAHPDVDTTAAASAALLAASEFGHADVLAYLLTHTDANPSIRNSSALYMAAQSGSVAAVVLLLDDARVDPDAGHNAALFWASYHGHVDVVTTMLAHPRVDPSLDPGPLTTARRAGHLHIVHLLAAAGCPE
ncbi:ankyrin [Thecamonas trahens ATCC 50062]|uniref:Ankyrin n=1 Tax=Thecamonas trahens ATCC 50062 TaxID=461836 RepID=A0A0L0D5L7_THETB|nr:ankyrin [Thecamonas trahens ATCC 50062]KNC47505.1 ankyrin [Thecamonas trahens ATCC 50062]|eukprot:XP_013759441.1 ankyrin [Thecamonas trahens ATCC 50062]